MVSNAPLPCANLASAVSRSRSALSLSVPAAAFLAATSARL